MYMLEFSLVNQYALFFGNGRIHKMKKLLINHSVPKKSKSNSKATLNDNHRILLSKRIPTILKKYPAWLYYIFGSYQLTVSGYPCRGLV